MLLNLEAELLCPRKRRRRLKKCRKMKNVPKGEKKRIDVQEFKIGKLGLGI